MPSHLGFSAGMKGSMVFRVRCQLTYGKLSTVIFLISFFFFPHRLTCSVFPYVFATAVRPCVTPTVPQGREVINASPPLDVSGLPARPLHPGHLAWQQQQQQEKSQKYNSCFLMFRFFPAYAYYMCIVQQRFKFCI